MHKMSNRKALVVLSGGQDSTTCLFWAKQWFDEVHAITFDYGQRHKIEIESAKKIAQLAEVASHEILEFHMTELDSVEGEDNVHITSQVLKGTSPLTNPNEELEQYTNHQSLPGGLEKTFVPMRNQLFLTIAANRAYIMSCADIVTGVCQEDFGGYPDCRRVFINALMQASSLGTFTAQDGAPGPLTIHTPLMDMSKAESIDLAIKTPGCYAALAHSHTAYDGQYPPTGHDHATLLRAKGFEEAGVPDPLILRAVDEGKMETPTTSNYSPDLVAKYSSELI